MRYTVRIEIDTESLATVTDQDLAALWHVAQANPAPIDIQDAGKVAEAIGREIVRRFLKATAPALWNHQGSHALSVQLEGLRARPEVTHG